MNIQELLNTAAVAGGIGGLVRFMVFRESVAEAVRNILSGSITAHYVSPVAGIALLNWVGIKVLPPPLTHEIYTGAVAFVIGFFGAFTLLFIQEQLTARRVKRAKA
jgi:hypothetical protein